MLGKLIVRRELWLKEVSREFSKLDNMIVMTLMKPREIRGIEGDLEWMPDDKWEGKKQLCMKVNAGR